MRLCGVLCLMLIAVPTATAHNASDNNVIISDWDTLWEHADATMTNAIMTNASHAIRVNLTHHDNFVLTTLVPQWPVI